MQRVSLSLGSQAYATAATDGIHHWMIDEPPEQGGMNTGPDPFAMLLSSLGSCTAITLRMYATRKGWDLGSIHVTLDLVNTGTGEERHSVFSIDITLTGNVDATQMQRLHQIARACPVSKLLEGKINIQTTIQKKTNEHTTTG